MRNKHGLGPVVATALLLVVAVVAVVGFQGWFSTYSSSMFSDVEIKSNSASSNDLGIDRLIGDILYVLNNLEANMTINKLEIDGVECLLNNNISKLGINELNVSDCVASITTSTPDIVLITEDKVIEKKVYVKDNIVSPVASLDVGSQCRFKDNKSGCESYYVLDNVDGIDVVHDTILGLYWEQNSSLTGIHNWTDAKNHCEVTLGNGWRLPTLVEMEASLVDTSIGTSGPYIIGNNSLFNNVQDYYWTDTRYSSTYAYIFYFSHGRSYYNLVTNHFCVLCVKTA